MSRTGPAIEQNDIRRYRHKRHLRLRDVAHLVGIENICHVADWEKGRRMPTLENALRLSVVIGCPVEILFLNRFCKIREGIASRYPDYSPFKEYLFTNKNKNAYNASNA